ncbi:MAG: hypothetical protein ACT4PL_10730 [Phycisphaerales bacterium]
MGTVTMYKDASPSVIPARAVGPSVGIGVVGPPAGGAAGAGAAGGAGWGER